MTAITLLSGCGSGWHRVEASPATTVPPRQQVMVYHGETAERWHAVRIDADSVTGIHWLRPIEGDTGRVALPLTMVDSLVAGDPAKGFVKSSIFTAYVALPVTLIAFCIITRACPSGD